MLIMFISVKNGQIATKIYKIIWYNNTMHKNVPKRLQCCKVLECKVSKK